MKDLCKLLRVKHYIKNLLIFIPFLFGGNIFDTNTILNVVISFFAFSAMASCIYIINDINDKSKDVNHPTKKERPIAKGKITISVSICIAIILFITSIILNYLSNSSFYSYVWLLSYFALNVLYSFKLKQVPIADIVLLVSFYIIRIYYGASIVDVPVSKWLYLTIMCIASFLAFSKRKNELAKMGDDTRPVLKYYTHEFLDKFMYLSLAISIAFYSLWAVEQSHEYFAYTIPLVFVIIMRYCLIVENSKEDDPIEVITKDKTLILLGLIYAIWCMYLVFIVGL